MQLHTEPKGDYTLARLDVARLDAAAAPGLRNATADLANQGKFRVVLDLGGVEFVDSSGLGALIHMHKTLQPQGGFAMCQVDPRVAQLFKVTRLDRVVAIAATATDAAALVKAGAPR
jgi:anti-sigma B factor antagonist